MLLMETVLFSPCLPKSLHFDAGDSALIGSLIDNRAASCLAKSTVLRGDGARRLKSLPHQSPYPEALRVLRALAYILGCAPLPARKSV